MIGAFRLAWSQLSSNGWRLLAAIAGVAFAAVLMLVQIGLQEVLFISVTKLFGSLRGDLILISPQYQCQLVPQDIPRQRVVQALAVPGVRDVEPIYLGQVQMRNPVTHRGRNVTTVGFRPRAGVFNLPDVDGGIPSLLQSDSVLFDRKSLPEFGPIPELLARGGPVTTQLGTRRVAITGLFTLGPSFACDGTVFTSDENFLRVFPYRRQERVDLGLIQLQPGASPQAVQAQLAAALPNDVRVLTRSEFIELEKNYWSHSLPVGYVLGLNVVIGLVVGLVIVYQILYTDVLDHLAEYATLKAMGYRDWYLVQIVLNEAVILSLLGYLPGYLVSLGVYAWTRRVTLLPLYMTWPRLAGVYALAAGMCVFAGVLAMRKLKKADPAEVF